MANSVIIQIPVDAETLDMIDRAAAWRGMTRDEFTAAALRHIAKMDSDLEAKIQEGIDDADAGRLISQEDMEAWFEARHRQAAAE